MAHRGRLNVLANIVGKSYGQIFREFEGNLDPIGRPGLGRREVPPGRHRRAPQPRRPASSTCTLASNPSHLEAVDPVVEGMRGPSRTERDDTSHSSTLAGAASTATPPSPARAWWPRRSTCRQLPGYRVGGTIHIVVNNQVGFTTAAEHARSSLYATDVAKMVQAPIFHVNGDDPEACVRVARLAFAYRPRVRQGRRDRHGLLPPPRPQRGRRAGLHPAPHVRPHRGPPVDPQALHRALVNRGEITVEEAEAALADFQARLEGAFAETAPSEPPPTEPLPAAERSTSGPATTGPRSTPPSATDGWRRSSTRSPPCPRASPSTPSW